MDSKQVSPRKKFSLASEVSMALRRYQLSRDGDWNLRLDKSVVTTICQAYRDKFLFVNGTEPQYYLPIYTIPELLQYLKVLPVPIASENPVGKRLRNTPLFSGIKVPNKTNGNQTQKVKVPIGELSSLYKWAEGHHKRTEGHHPDGLGWNSGVFATIECVFDIFNSLLRTNSLISSYSKLFNILLDSKFTALDIQGIFYAFLHISIRGVALTEQLYNSGNWRREGVSQELLFKICNDFSNGMQPRSLISAYVQETQLHANCINTELKRLRIKVTNHDYTKFDPRMIYAYAWKWGIFERFNSTNKHRFESGIYREQSPALSGNPTMFTLGSSFGEGFAKSEAVTELFGLLKELPNDLEKKVEKSLTKVVDDFDKKVDKQQEKLANNAEDLISKAAEKQINVSSEILEKISSKTNEIGENILKSMEPVIESLRSFMGLIEGMITKVSEFLSPLPGFSKIKLSSETLFNALTYYIMYINTTSTVLKTIMIVLILNSFGLIKTAFSEILHFWSWINDSVVLNGKEVTANETSGVFEWLMSSPYALAQTIGGLIAGMIKGVPLSSKEFLSLSKALADNLKNFHFISQGIAGITKLFDYCRKAYTIVVEWVAEHIFGKTPEKVLLAKKVSKLSLLVKYLHTEAGLNAIRMSERTREVASGVLAKYLALQAECRSKPEFRVLFLDLEKLNRQVKEISDFVTRLKAISNFQPTMFHIQFVGRPGIGKSTITKNVVTDLSKTLWPDDSKPSFYSYNTDLEYFDGYAGQKIMIVDDLYKINDPKHLTASMFLVTNTPVILPMANLNDKGVQMTSEILLTSTNTAYPIGKDVLCMEAIHRRRHMLVEVICDPDVIDTSIGQFSISHFNKKYPDKKPTDFPHLTFNLLRPVPKEFGGATMTVNQDEFDLYKRYAEELRDANLHIALADRKLPTTFYFSEENRPPQGINLPASGWTYDQFISNCAVRFAAFRGSEGTYTTQSKYAHVETCLAEIDMLLEQQNDIPDGEHFELFHGIESLLNKCQHPYGSQDELGQRLFDTSNQNLAPELADIDFEKIVNDILEENVPTGLSVNDERERTASILARRGRRLRDPILEDMLRIEDIEGGRYIPLRTFYTGWHEPPSVNSEKLWHHYYAMREVGYLSKQQLEEVNPSAGFMYILYQSVIKGSRQTVRDGNTILKWAMSPNMFFPDNQNFPADLRGKDTKFPISFYKDLEKKNGRWYLNVKNIEFVPGTNCPEISLTPYPGGPLYDVKADIALLLSCMPTFRIFMSDFENLTTIQQDLLVQEAKWRNAFTGSYTYEKVYQDCQNIYAQLGYKTLHYITNPFRYIIEHYPFVCAVIGYFIAYFAIIFTISKVTELFHPQPTSKVLHRAPQASLINYGRPTSQENSMYQFTTSFVERNIRDVTVMDSRAGYKVQAIVSEQYVILNKHAFRYIKDDKIRIDIRHLGREPTGYYVSMKDVYLDPDGDLAIIYSPGFPSARKIDNILMTAHEYLSHDLGEEIIIASQSGSSVIIDHHRCLGKEMDLVLKNKTYQNKIDHAVLVKGMTAQGRSGSGVLTWRTSRPRLLGIQAWEVDNIVYPKIAIQVITLEKYDDLKAKIRQQLGIMPIERLVEPEFTEVVGTETAAFQDVPREHLVCTDDHSVGVVRRSLIKPSIIFDSLQKEGIKTASCPAALSPYDERLYHGNSIHPLAHSIGKYFRGNIEPFDPDILSYASTNLAKYIDSRLDKHDFRELSFEDVITGTREDGSNPMNLTSSPGIPFIFDKVQKGKKDYLQINEEGVLEYVDVKFRADYYKFLDTLSDRKLPYTRAYDFPKDELRPLAKALGTENTPPKTRSVTCMNVYYVMAWRQVLLDFWATMHRAADGTFTFCPGINPEGPDWNNAYHYLSQHPNAVDFDVSNWDGHLRADLFLEALNIIKLIVKPNNRLSNIIDSITYEVFNSYIQYSNVVYQKHRGIISGFPGTAEMNTLCHWLLIVYIYLKSTQGTNYNTLTAMLANVATLIYGDDIIITFSNEISPYFNGHTIQNWYQTIGYPVTSASKDTVVEMSKPLNNCTFLKSSWREFLPNYYIRKIDNTVINNLVCWVRAKQDPTDQFYENYLDALRLAFSSGRSVFEDFQQKVNRALIRESRDIITFDYLDFERDYIQRYLPQLSYQEYKIYM
ncbi:RNA-dependent RNA polymerase [Colobopsis shohki virus 1]|nr:RNA-dependent RNA polymerase [Colobopsis shohki virus 1]